MTAQDKGQKVVFLVDDDPDFLEIFGAKLSAAGFSVIPYQNPETAVKEAEERQPDLIALDVQMPEMNGIQALDNLKSNPKTRNIKIVFLTNAGSNEAGTEWLDQKFAKDAGATDHIRKSDDLDAIVTSIKNICDNG